MKEKDTYFKFKTCGLRFFTVLHFDTFIFPSSWFRLNFNNKIAEPGTRQHFCDNVTLCFQAIKLLDLKIVRIF